MEDKDEVTILAVDGLATQGSKVSTAMMMTYFSRDILPSAPLDLRYHHDSKTDLRAFLIELTIRT